MADKKTNIDDNLRIQYALLIPKYERLGHNLREALESFLMEHKIPYVSVDSRIKGFDSFAEKVEKKNYEDPFNDTEDLCGLRIICYFQSDMSRIKKVIEHEFEIIDSFDKEKGLSPTEFGYRSSHFIVKIKKGWLQAPNYRGLQDLKVEIQVRTILMHSWAEIEHKLAYKKHEHIPPQFRRKFSRISAKLEEADEQFEELIHCIGEHKEGLVQDAKKQHRFDQSAELNLDSMQAFLDFHFPEGRKDIAETRDLVDEFHRLKVTIGDLVTSYERVRDYLPHIEPQINGIKKGINQSALLKEVLDAKRSKKLISKKLKIKKIRAKKA